MTLSDELSKERQSPAAPDAADGQKEAT